MTFVPPLVVHLSWFANDDRDPRCVEIATELYELLHRPRADDPVLRPGLEIRTEFGRDAEDLATALASGTEPTAAIRLAILVLDAAAYNEPAQRSTVAKLGALATADVVVLAVILDERWINELDDDVTTLVPSEGPERRWKLGSQVAQEAVRALRRSTERVVPRVLISYARSAETPIAKSLAGHFKNEVDIGAWYGEAKTGRGEDLAKELGKTKNDAIVLVLRTDNYSESPAGEVELLAAKKARAPIVTLVAMQDGESWSSAYGGNHRTIQWREDRVWEITARCLQAWLHAHYFRAYAIAALARAGLPSNAEILPHRPELLDLVTLPADRRLLVHPDPPLTEAQTLLLRAARSDVRFATPTTLLGRVLLARDPRPPLAGSEISFSMSISDDLPRVADGRLGSGLTREYLYDLANSIVLATLNSGARIAYGGDFRDESFTQRLAELHRSRRRLGSGAGAQLVCFLDNNARPGAADRAEYAPVEVELPPAANALENPKRSYLWISMMREVMAERSVGRVIVSGKTLPMADGRDRGFWGPWSGIVEEALRTLMHGRALFLIGGFGGITQLMTRMLRTGQLPDELLDATHATSYVPKRLADMNEARAKLVGVLPDAVLLREPSGEFLAGEGMARKLLAYWQRFVGGDVSAWNNGLSVDENLRLFECTDRTEIMNLVFEGLRRVSRRQAGHFNIAVYYGDIATIPDVNGYGVTVTPGVPPIGASAALDKRLGGLLSSTPLREDGNVTLINGRSNQLAGTEILVAKLLLPAAGGVIDARTISALAEEVAIVADDTGIESIACATFGSTMGLGIAESARAMIEGFRTANVTALRTVALCEFDRTRYEELRAAFPLSEVTELHSAATHEQLDMGGAVLQVDADVTDGKEVRIRATLLARSNNQPVVPRNDTTLPFALWTSLRQPIETFEDSANVGKLLWTSILSETMREQMTDLDDRFVVLTDLNASGLPWELLTDASGTARACTNGVVRRVALVGPSRPIDPRERRRTYLRVLVVVDPTKTLHHAQAEVDDVTAALKKRPDVQVEQLDPANATVAELAARLRRGFFDVLHFAGHASFDEANPENSGLQMSDGVFGSAALADVPLPRFVFLSACESGRLRAQRNEAPAPAPAKRSLAESFLRTGVPALVGTFFTVDDSSARRFATATHLELASGKLLGAAVRSARKELFDDKVPDWGNFLLFGDDALSL